MSQVTFVRPNGAVIVVEVPTGQSLMQAALARGVPGIDADCGGACACACATCHVFVDPAWRCRTGLAGEMEQSMLGFAEGAAPNSRLACQIKMSDGLDGLVVRLPEAQH